MRIAAGLFVMLFGLGLLAAGLCVRFGWDVAAMVIGVAMTAIALWSMPDDSGGAL